MDQVGFLESYAGVAHIAHMLRSARGPVHIAFEAFAHECLWNVRLPFLFDLSYE